MTHTSEEVLNITSIRVTFVWFCLIMFSLRPLLPRGKHYPEFYS